MLPGWCCIANRHIGARERRQLIPPHVRFQVPFLGPESQLKSGFACAGLLCSKSICWLLKCSCNVCCKGRPLLWILRFCGLILVPPDGLKNGRLLIFCLLQGSAFAVDFAILRSHFWYRLTVSKNGTVKVLFFCSFTKLCMRSQKWDRQAVPFLGPCLGSFFEVFCIRVAEAQSFGFNETLWLMATGRATREALLSEAGFEKVFRTQNWVRRSKLFCRWFCFLLGQAGCISVAA